MYPPHMKLRILCIDDLYGRYESDKEILLHQLSDEGPLDAWCDLFFCSGQSERSDELFNDIDLVLDAVGRSEEDAARWDLVLLDAQFISGRLSSHGIPQGRPGDDDFGDSLRNGLLSLHPGLPLVTLSSKSQSELLSQDLPYLSKKGLNARALKRTLLRYGGLDIDQRRALLGMPTETVTRSMLVLGIYEKAFAHARTGTPCLLLGESGVGKELLARYLHDQSRRTGQFVAVNVAAIPKDLIESELFGIEKNTATGVSARQGFFEQAANGTLFLDEIGDLPLDAQVKLLRVLQENEVTRVGGRETKRFDVRLLTATSRNLEAMVLAGSFRKDLLYRINTLVLTLPPLRKRPEDMALLAENLLARTQTTAKKEGISFAREALEQISLEQFPGNIRELEALVRRIIATAGNHEVISLTMVAELLAPLDTEAGLPMTEVTTAQPASSFVHPIGSTSPDLDDPARARERKSVPLGGLLDVLDSVVIDQDDPSLNGFKPKIEAALGRILLRAAGAALNRCRDPFTGEFNRQKAMKLLSGDTGNVGRGPARMINELLGRSLQTKVEKSDLEHLVALWRNRDS